MRMSTAVRLLALLVASHCTPKLYAHTPPVDAKYREAAAETRYVNAVVRRAGLDSVFHGSRDGGAERLVASLQRPGVQEARIVAILVAYLAADEDASTLIVDDRHQFVLRQGDLVAAWSEGIEEQVDTFSGIETSECQQHGTFEIRT